MFEKILIANRGNQLPGGSAAARPNRPVAGSHKRYFTAIGNQDFFKHGIGSELGRGTKWRAYH